MTQRRVIHPVVDVLRNPNGPRDRQLLFGDTVELNAEEDGWGQVTSDKDGYQGWVRLAHLGPISPQTHWVIAAATHVYEQADLKSPDLASLSFGSKIRALSEKDGYLETEMGFVPRMHTVPAYAKLTDPVAVAEQMIGTPYLWGGNSRNGIDCSGLVQAGLLACGIPCPGDSGDQEQALGQHIPEGTPFQRGDLLFWKGHVAWVAGDNLLLHANAHHMAVAYEPMDQAIARIKAQGDGPVTARKRL